MDTLAVTRFKADNVHLNLESIGAIQNQVRRPASQYAQQIVDEIRPNVDVRSVHNVCSRVNSLLNTGNNGRMGGLLDAINSDINSDTAFVRNQINGVRSFGNDFVRGGMSNCRFSSVSPPDILSNMRNSVFSQIRNFSSLNFNIDSLLLGEQLRNILVRSINGICGLNLSMDNMFGNLRSLLDILNNMNLFNNSDLLAAIARCAFLTREHSAHLSRHTTTLAAQGNTRAVRDIIINIPDTRVMQDDINIMINVSQDSSSNAQDVIEVMEATGRSTDRLLSDTITIDNQPVNIPSIKKASNIGSKPIFTKKIIENSEIFCNKGTTTKINNGVINRSVDLLTPVVVKKTEKGKQVIITSEKEKIILKNNVATILSGVKKEQKAQIQELTSKNKNSDINFGIHFPSTDLSLAEVKRPAVMLKSNPSNSWGNNTFEEYPLSSTENFSNPSEDVLLKSSSNTLYMTDTSDEVPTDILITQLKKTVKASMHRFNDLQKFGSCSVERRSGCITGWKKIVQPNGHEVRYAIY